MSFASLSGARIPHIPVPTPLETIDTRTASALFPSVGFVTTTSLSVAEGDVVCAYMHVYGTATSITFTDSGGHTWVSGTHSTMSGSGSPDTMSNRIGYFVATATGSLTVTATMGGSPSGAITYGLYAQQMRGGPVLHADFFNGYDYRAGADFDDAALTGLSQVRGSQWICGEGRPTGASSTDTWTWIDGTTNASTTVIPRTSAGNKFVPKTAAGSVRVHRGQASRSHIFAAVALSLGAR